jgi:hypothetical protein
MQYTEPVVSALTGRKSAEMLPNAQFCIASRLVVGRKSGLPFITHDDFCMMRGTDKPANGIRPAGLRLFSTAD